MKKNNLFKALKLLSLVTLIDRGHLIFKLAQQKPLPPSIWVHGSVMVGAALLFKAYSQDKPENIHQQSLEGSKLSKLSMWVTQHRRGFLWGVAALSNLDRIASMYVLHKRDPDSPLLQHILMTVLSVGLAAAVHYIDRPSALVKAQQSPRPEM